MRPEQLDLNLLKVFEALYREGNVSAAATVLHLTPSAVSHALKRLRGQLGEPLFERHGNGMRPTPSCQRMAPQLLAQLSQLRQLLRQWGHFDPAQARLTFQLGVPDALEPLVLPTLARQLDQHAPGCSLISRRVERGQLSRELAQGLVDLAVDVCQPAEPELCLQPLLSDELVVLSRSDRTSLSREAYQEAAHVVVSRRARGAVLEEAALAAIGVARRTPLRCQGYASAARIVAQSQHLLTLPRHLAEPLLTPSLVLHPCPLPLSPIPIGLYWHRGRQEDPALSWLRETLLTALPQQLGATR
ncbi:LysR family transcriptional regulator [Ferrimonas balearica]|uniref:LysR family transcriptional regulator n=1 Tax=Ferrimonas balearica TaxID=44012 RepID=UPI001C983C08|nr:LysR family transcriptional regulator [Ferrimonas balearica]MBY5980473.1 LysR family transcriptional regulator [Ferrimonas balearica]